MKTKRSLDVVSVLRVKFVAFIVAITSCTMFLSSCEKDEELFSDENYVENTDQEIDSSTTNGSTNKYEKPDVGIYDYTAGYSTLTVKYRIYNKDEAKVSSAKILLGTSSNRLTTTVNATVSGSTITAYFRGLEEGTTYYVKCIASGKGGTTTTGVSRVMTNGF